MRLFLAVFSVILCLTLSLPAYAFTAHAENLGPVHSCQEEGVQLLKVSLASFLADRIHYALIDKDGLVLAVTPEVSRYTHKLDCGRPHVCLVYDVWHLNPAEWQIWDLEYGLDNEERKDFFPSHGKEEWMDFIRHRDAGKFESLTLKDMAEKPFGAKNIRGDYLPHQIIIALLIVTVFYLSASAAHAGHIGFKMAGFFGYGLFALLFIFLLADAFATPLLYFGAIIAALLASLYKTRKHVQAAAARRKTERTD